MRKIYEQYIQACTEAIARTGYLKAVSKDWEELQQRFRKDVLKDCLKSDYLILMKRYKRITDKKYPY